MSLPWVREGRRKAPWQALVSAAPEGVLGSDKPRAKAAPSPAQGVWAQGIPALCSHHSSLSRPTIRFYGQTLFWGFLSRGTREHPEGGCPQGTVLRTRTGPWGPCVSSQQPWSLWKSPGNLPSLPSPSCSFCPQLPWSQFPLLTNQSQSKAIPSGFWGSRPAEEQHSNAPGPSACGGTPPVSPKCHLCPQSPTCVPKGSTCVPKASPVPPKSHLAPDPGVPGRPKPGPRASPVGF